MKGDSPYEMVGSVITLQSNGPGPWERVGKFHKGIIEFIFREKGKGLHKEIANTR